MGYDMYFHFEHLPLLSIVGKMPIQVAHARRILHPQKHPSPSHLGYNLKVTDLQAAVGCEQLKKLPDFVRKRRHNWDSLRKALECALDDITNGMLPLGGNVNRGHGVFTGNWTCNKPKAQ